MHRESSSFFFGCVLIFYFREKKKMSSSTTSESVEYTGPNAAARSPEQSSFSRTCNLLSQYLKEKGSFGDLSLGMTCNFTGPIRETKKTMNLFPGIETTTDSQPNPNTVPSSRNLLRSMELFPRLVSFVPPEEDFSANKCTNLEPQADQMTIFCGGQVIVFDDFPADKAQEIFLLASRWSSQARDSVFPPNNVINPAMTHPMVAEAATSPVSSTSNAVPIPFQPTPRPIVSDLPLARRASLQRFLEKRKDRITSKAPYQVNSPLATPPPKKPAAAESRTWLALATLFPQ